MKTFTLQRASEARPAVPEGLAKHLNPQQLAAAVHGDGPALVVAGAGTGKTRVLTHRVAQLVSQGVRPAEILLLTFTRRAAQQMLQRAATLVGARFDDVEGGTFHAFAHRTLRRHALLLGFATGFTVLDEGDANDTLELVRARFVPPRGQRFPRKDTIRAVYSHMVSRGLGLEEAIRQKCPQFLQHAGALAELQIAWAEFKRAHDLMDFDDLLVNLNALLAGHPEVRGELARRYKHILIDEYQDTNRVQGELVQHLAGEEGNLLVVGDEAQSIYGFRGADVRNILEFPERFPTAKVYRLEQNYRSTQPILDVANAVMEGAAEGFGKVLFTEREGGETPLLVDCPDAQAQAEFIAQRILADREQGVSLGEQAVLFRSARHSAELELELTRLGIPFQKYGGQRFFDTAHVKDVLAHLKAFQNPSDLVSWHRLLRLLPGIGSATAVSLAEAVQALGDAALIAQAPAPPKAREALTALAELFNELGSTEIGTADRLDAAVRYYQPILEARFDDHPRRRKDLDQLIALAEGFSTLPALLADLALDPPQASGEVTDSDPEDEILTLSTIHSAKGLEWSHVYLMWAADGYLPSSFAMGDAEAIEEERRLMYVAVTRARTQLMICYPSAVHDRIRGHHLAYPSRFLAGIPDAQLEPAKLTIGG